MNKLTVTTSAPKRPHALFPCVLLAPLLVALALSFAPAAEGMPDHHDAVLDLEPVGYWPADEGEGDVLHDLSDNENHGTIYHVPWHKDRDLLNFTSAYQWLEIPEHEAYQAENFTLGGWMFSRERIYGGRWAPGWGPHRGGMLLMGTRQWHQRSGIQICVRGPSSRAWEEQPDRTPAGLHSAGLVEVISSGQHEALGARKGRVTVARRAWQHVLYSYEEGTGKLYVNGRLVYTKEDVPYESVEANLEVGNDAYWWHQSVTSGSLNGSVRDMVFFDRALSPEEVKQLYDATRPQVEPKMMDEDAIVIDQVEYQHIAVNGRQIRLADLSGTSVEVRRQALEVLEKREAEEIRPMSEELLPVLRTAIEDWQTRGVATSLLVKLGSDEAQTALREEALPLFVRAVQDRQTLRKARVKTLLALAEMGGAAREAVPAVVSVLDGILEREGVRLPRVEDLMRNACIRALLDIDPNGEDARKVLGRALGKPILDFVDLSQSYLSEVQSLVEKGRYMDALDAFRKLPLQKHGEHFFTQRKDRDYTATAHYEGNTYKVGTGRAWEGVEKVSPEQFKEIVADVADEYPAARDWRSPEYERLYRVPITKIGPDGTEKKIYLEGKNFVLDGRDAKVRAWSLFVDELGYIHVIGGQHNTPDPRWYIPGSWEKIGLSRDRGDDKFPQQLYWISSEPESIDSFDFVGLKDDPRSIPAGYLNYIVFVQSPQNETYLYGRNSAYGWQCWSMFRFDAQKSRWTKLGGDPVDVMQSAREHNPDWFDYLHHNIAGNKVPDEPTGAEALVWAWQPGTYNFCRDDWGARFDKTNRMHVHMQIWGLNERGYNVLSGAYAYSDDQGRTFHRADGSRVELPLTINPSPDHNADIRQGSSDQWWRLWTSLLRYAGYTPPHPSTL